MKSKFTLVQRLEIYLMAYKAIEERPTISFCCNEIASAANVSKYDNSVLDSFPEFAMFEPSHNETVWFKRTNDMNTEWEFTQEQTREQRLFCLLSCAEIIKQGIPIE